MPAKGSDDEARLRRELLELRARQGRLELAMMGLCAALLLAGLYYVFGGQRPRPLAPAVRLPGPLRAVA